MGGMGSGRRWYHGAKGTTSDYRSIDVRRWKRDGFLTPGQSFVCQWSHHGEILASIRARTEVDRVVLTYRHQKQGEGEWRNECYPVYLDWTPCHFGGERPWFRCPTHGCGRRVAILFGARKFACRHCRQLSYLSQREPWHYRTIRRADKIREKLRWEPGIITGYGSKPKGMHWHTFEKLIAQHDAFAGRSFVGLAKKIKAFS